MGLIKSKSKMPMEDKPKGSSSMAIAYNMKKKSKKMAEGGDVMKAERHAHDKGTSASGAKIRSGNRSMDFSKHPIASAPSIHREMGREDHREAKERAAESLYAEHDRPKPKLKGLAEGGDVEGDHIDRILSKCMSEGGVVSNEQGEHADEMPNEFDDMVLDDHLDFHDTAANSGDDLGSKLNQKEDMQDRILRKRASK